MSRVPLPPERHPLCSPVYTCQEPDWCRKRMVLLIDPRDPNVRVPGAREDRGRASILSGHGAHQQVEHSRDREANYPGDVGAAQQLDPSQLLVIPRTTAPLRVSSARSRPQSMLAAALGRGESGPRAPTAKVLAAGGGRQ